MQLRHLLLALFFAMQAEDDPELNEVDFVDDTPSENKVRYTIFFASFYFPIFNISFSFLAVVVFVMNH